MKTLHLEVRGEKPYTKQVQINELDGQGSLTPFELSGIKLHAGIVRGKLRIVNPPGTKEKVDVFHELSGGSFHVEGLGTVWYSYR